MLEGIRRAAAEVRLEHLREYVSGGGRGCVLNMSQTRRPAWNLPRSAISNHPQRSSEPHLQLLPTFSRGQFRQEILILICGTVLFFAEHRHSDSLLRAVGAERERERWKYR